MPSAFEVELLNGALDAIAHLNPEYSEFITWIKNHETRAANLANVIDAAIRAGGSAMAAIERDAPDLASAIKLFVSAASPEGNGKRRACTPKMSRVNPSVSRR